MCLPAVWITRLSSYSIFVMFMAVCLYFTGDVYSEYNKIQDRLTVTSWMYEKYCISNREINGFSGMEDQCTEWRTYAIQNEKPLRTAISNTDKQWSPCMGMPCIEYFGAKASDAVWYMCLFFVCLAFLMISLCLTINAISRFLGRGETIHYRSQSLPYGSYCYGNPPRVTQWPQLDHSRAQLEYSNY